MYKMEESRKPKYITCKEFLQELKPNYRIKQMNLLPHQTCQVCHLPS